MQFTTTIVNALESMHRNNDKDALIAAYALARDWDVAEMSDHDRLSLANTGLIDEFGLMDEDTKDVVRDHTQVEFGVGIIIV